MTFYKRKLPHRQPVGAEFFITFRLSGSLPSEAIEKLRLSRKQLQKQGNPTKQDRIRKAIFQKYEQFLDNAETGLTWLGEEKIAHVVQEALLFYNKKDYDLYASCIMPNHVHMVFRHIEKEADIQRGIDYPITKILHSIKSYTALECNKLLDRKGKFWQSESYDRVIRDSDELEKTIRYLLNNPVKAGLVQSWEEWAFTYCKPTFIETFT